MSDTRDMVEASWRAASRAADVTGAVMGNHVSVAGQYLAAANGCPDDAVNLLPRDGGVFWARVRSVLADVAREDHVAEAMNNVKPLQSRH